MTTLGKKRRTLSNFIMKLCSLERFIEVKRQLVCDMPDFEPYSAFLRFTRLKSAGITPFTISAFMNESLLDGDLADSKKLVKFYDYDNDGLLSYTEFLNILLPKEHPDLRAFVTQRECLEIQNEEYFGYETEVALAALIDMESSVFQQLACEKEELDSVGLDATQIMREIVGDENGAIDFNNVQQYLNKSGLLPYDSEIIAFLRRIDRNDDGLVSQEELSIFLEIFDPTEPHNVIPGRLSKSPNPMQQWLLERTTPGRRITKNMVSVLSPEKGTRIVYKENVPPTQETFSYKRGYTLSHDTISSLSKPRGSREEATALRTPSPKPRQIYPSPADSTTAVPFSNMPCSSGGNSTPSETKATPTSVVVDTLLSLIPVERKIEALKIALSQDKTFSVAQLVERIAPPGSEWFTLEDFKEFLSSIRIAPSLIDNIEDLYSMLDATPNSILSNQALLNLLAPRSAQIPLNSSRGGPINQAIIDLLRELFSSIFEQIIVLNRGKKRIQDERIDLKKSFDELGLNFEFGADIGQFVRGISKLNHSFGYIPDCDYQCLFSINDIDKDKRITFKDFYLLLAV